LYCSNQRHILRDRRPSMTACPARWAMGTKELEVVHGSEKKIFSIGPTKKPRQNKNLFC
jgi:hypothetical protein